MKVIASPKQCQNEIGLYGSTVRSYYEAIKSPTDEVLLDCGNVGFIRPMGINLLSAMIFVLLQKGDRNVYLTSPSNSDVKRYLADQGFYEEFQVHNNAVSKSPRSTSVGLKRMILLDYSYLETVAGWLAANSSLPEEAIQQAIKLPLIEVINNVFDHSGSGIGCYICAQGYPREGRLVFSLVDFGVGFLSPLSRVYKDLKTNADAIDLAIKEGVTSKIELRKRGAGLYLLSDFFKKFSGRLEIISGDGRWVQEQDGSCLKENMKFKFPGTCINLDFTKETVLDCFQEEITHE